MGLRYPEDLEAWQRWQQRAGSPLARIGRVKARLLRRDESQGGRFSLYLTGQHPQLVTVMESFSPSTLAAQRSWTASFAREDVAFAAPSGYSNEFGAGTTEIVLTSSDLDQCTALDEVRAVVGPGHYLPIGGALHTWCQRRETPFFVVQHGLMTACAPPLPQGATLLAWSAADGEFWRSGREDVSVVVVGSQLFWDVAHAPRTASVEGPPLTYLGQLHGAELPQAAQARSAMKFCLRTGAHYRPHPGEKDLGSRLWHRVMRARGVTFADTSIALRDLDGAVVSAFSTGVLEAAARGSRAYVHHEQPPAWLTDFWQRYDMRPYDSGRPTPAPSVPAEEPAQVIAHTLRKALDR